MLTPANVADSDPAPELLQEVPAEVRFVLGDRHYNVPELWCFCQQQNRFLVATHYGRYPHTDAGVEVRRIFHKLRSAAIENFNEHFKGIFDGHGQVPDLWVDRDPTLRERRRSSSTNSRYCTDSRMASTYVSDSRPFSKRPEYL